MSKIRVLVVDDSAMIRKLITQILSSDKDIDVVGVAEDPMKARELIKALNPDVITLDVEMPKMDGITFLKNLMRLRPMPVVMLSTLTAKGTDATLEALNTGAVDFVCKPAATGAGLDECAREIIYKVKNAARARVGKTNIVKPSAAKSAQISALNPKSLSGHVKMIAIGASTGGTEAISAVLEGLPEFMPPIVLAQHIPEEFSGPFAKRVNTKSAMMVKEAEHHEPILPGHAYLAPGSHHLEVEKCGAGRWRCSLNLKDPVNRHRPSVDVLFDSVADQVGKGMLAALLTGMGKDGAKGLLKLRESGARTIAQDENSSVVWGMPGQAVKIGAAEFILPLNKVADKLIYLASEKPKREPVLEIGAR